jgi:drug/metabolite transporter (DMT)-like permease
MKNHNLTERDKGIAAVLILALMYGILPMVTRILDASFTLSQQVYLRMAIGCLFTFIVFSKFIDITKIFRLSTKENIFIFLRSFVYFFLGVGLYTQALLLTKISNVEFIGAIPMTALLGFILLKEKVTASKVALVLISFFGVLIISVKDFSTLSQFGLGELYAFLAAFFIAVGLVSRRWQTEKINDRESSMLMLFYAAVQFGFASFIYGEGLPVNGWTSEIMFTLFAAGVMIAAVSLTMNYGFVRVDAVLAGNLLSISPFIAILLAYFFYAEVPTGREFIGGILIIISALMLHRIESKGK